MVLHWYICSILLQVRYLTEHDAMPTPIQSTQAADDVATLDDTL